MILARLAEERRRLHAILDSYDDDGAPGDAALAGLEAATAMAELASRTAPGKVPWPAPRAARADGTGTGPAAAHERLPEQPHRLCILRGGGGGSPGCYAMPIPEVWGACVRPQPGIHTSIGFPSTSTDLY